MISQNEMIRRASKHYVGWCERNGYIPAQPSTTLSEARRGGLRVTVLRNVNGELARYVYDEKYDRMRPLSFGGNHKYPDGRRIR